MRTRARSTTVLWAGLVLVVAVASGASLGGDTVGVFADAESVSVGITGLAPPPPPPPPQPQTAATSDDATDGDVGADAPVTDADGDRTRTDAGRQDRAGDDSDRTDRRDRARGGTTVTGESGTSTDHARGNRTAGTDGPGSGKPQAGNGA
jgi:hypothetical protein